MADARDMGAIAAGADDSARRLEVLAHVPDPFMAMPEGARVLRPGGVLDLSVPHLSRLHDLPHDDVRCTRHGVERLLAAGGLELVEPRVRGGILGFLEPAPGG